MPDAGKIQRPARLQPVASRNLALGMTLQTPLYDENGHLLLARHAVIDSPTLLATLREHPALFTDERAIQETARAVMASFEEASRRDIPLGKLPAAGIAAAPAEAMATPVAPRPASVRPPPDLAEHWRNLESKLGGVLAGLALGGNAAQEALKRLDQLHEQLHEALEHDLQSATFLLFSRSVTGFAGYSVLHSLLCAVVAWDASRRLPVSADESQALFKAALTMNVSIKVLQDQMASQRHAPTQDQLLAIGRHAEMSERILRDAGVDNPLWLGVVRGHHDDLPYNPAINNREPVEKLTKILQVIDRYTAAMSPRGSRAGRPPRDAARTVIRTHGGADHDEVGLDLMQNLGLYPPGTFVQLRGGEVAVVLRPGGRPDQPWVATVVNKAGEPIQTPRLLATTDATTAVASGLSGSDVKVRLNETALLRVLQDTRPVGLGGTRA
ncbi:HD-GYP domain-containing protein [Hydrogenophaga soli]